MDKNKILKVTIRKIEEVDLEVPMNEAIEGAICYGKSGEAMDNWDASEEFFGYIFDAYLNEQLRKEAYEVYNFGRTDTLYEVDPTNIDDYTIYENSVDKALDNGRYDEE